jgi:hypothetical protein
MRAKGDGRSRRSGDSGAIGGRNRWYGSLIAAFFIAVLSFWAATPPAMAENIDATGDDQGTRGQTFFQDNLSPKVGDGLTAGSRDAAGQRVILPDSLQSCCDWNAVTAFLSSARGHGPRTMAQTLYVLSAQDALKVVNDALKVQKYHLSASKTAAKKGGSLVSLRNSLRTSNADLQAEIKALSDESIPEKGDLLRNMKNALAVVQRDLAVHERILEGKEAPPVLLGKIARLDRLLFQVSEDCRKYLSGER